MKIAAILLFASTIGFASLQSISTAQAASPKEKSIYSFCGQPYCADGASPSESDNLIAVNGKLYATTVFGGAYGLGAVFALDPKTGKEKVIHSFCSDAKGYRCVDGSLPVGGLVDVNGILYGTTQEGGVNGCDSETGCGIVYSIDLASGTFAIIHKFSGKSDGYSPETGLAASGSILYGTTIGGGKYMKGTVFAVDLSAGTEKVLHSFGRAGDGYTPYAAPIVVNGMLYGTTVWGGNGCRGTTAIGCGTLYSLDPITGKEKTLYSFCTQTNCVDGADAESTMIAVDGVLYGTTVSGGTTGCTENSPSGCGTVFSFDPATGTETVLHSFGTGSDGKNPEGGLMALDGKLYGTTLFGGDGGCSEYGGCGTVFALDSASGAEKVLYSFLQGSGDKIWPNAALLAVNGTLYGTTVYGGNSDAGTVFSLRVKH